MYAHIQVYMCVHVYQHLMIGINKEIDGFSKMENNLIRLLNTDHKSTGLKKVVP